MIGLYIKAGLKKAVDITPTALEDLQRAPVLWQSFLPKPRDYRKYSRLVGWTNTATIHPFYWQVRGLPLQLRLLTHPKSPFKLLGLVHLQNRVDEYTEARVDIPCELVARFATVYQHRRGLAVEVSVTGTQRGKRVYAATGVFLMRTSKKPGQLPAYNGTSVELSDSAQHSASFAYTGAMVRKYAWISGDFNPINLSTLTARLLGFKRAIVHGMYSGACAVSALDQQEALTGQKIELVFKRPVLVPAETQLFTEKNSDGRAFHLISKDRQEGEVFLTGQTQPAD